jgi:hypothetical protein
MNSVRFCPVLVPIAARVTLDFLPHAHLQQSELGERKSGGVLLRFYGDKKLLWCVESQLSVFHGAMSWPFHANELACE